MNALEMLNAAAAKDGIESYGEIRDTLISWRNEAMGPGFDPNAVVFLSHVIWWVSILKPIEVES